MINLLPHSTLKRARREYYIRLVSLALLSLAVVCFSSAAFLVPSYLSARIERSATLERHVLLTQKTASDTSALSASLLTTTDLLSAARRPNLDGMALLAQVLSGKGSRIQLTRIAFDTRDVARFSVSGIAQSREALLQFRDALRSRPEFTAVELPISNLAKATDIEFSMAITIKPPLP